jgi:hypothetical protein
MGHTPKPPKPAPIPAPTDSAVVQAGLEAAAERRRRQGIASSVLTGGAGLLTQNPSPAAKLLMGG